MYEKQTWNTGDVITEEKLNHMEDGIASGGMFVVGGTYDESTQTTTLDKTWKEIADAVEAGRNVIFKKLDDSIATTFIDTLASYGSPDNTFEVSFSSADIFSTDSENGYPSYTEGGGGHN